MEILTLNSNEINQNGYHINKLTRNKIGFIYIAPANIIPDDCLACDGYVLKISDNKKLYSAIGKTYNTGVENDDEFRIPDYNITGRFLQPSQEVGTIKEAGLPTHKHFEFSSKVDGASSDNKSTQQLRNNMQVNSLWYSGYAAYVLARTNSAADVGLSSTPNNSIYGNSTTVQPPAQTVYLCIKYK